MKRSLARVSNGQQGHFYFEVEANARRGEEG